MSTTPTLPTKALLTGPPILVVGWRTGRSLEGRRIETHTDTHAVLRAVCEDAVDTVNAATTSLKPYSSFGILEPDEVFFIGPGSASASDVDSASLTDFVKNAHALVTLPKSELDQKMAFYAIVWGAPGAGRVGFVRKSDARAILARGAHFFTYGQTLRTTARPDLVLDDTIDLILRDQTVLMMSESRARTLMNDIGLAKEGIKTNVSGLATILGGSTAITSAASAAFEARASKSVNFARRLAKFNAYYESRTLDPKKVREVAQERSSDPDTLLDSNGVVVADEAHVEAALDLIEGRFFMDPISEEERRADRLSTRKP
jgi:hypothetical protein